MSDKDEDVVKKIDQESMRDKNSSMLNTAYASNTAPVIQPSLDV